ncbi:hypothetical protein BD779DRAFT_1554867 [Infundibulicybe gibba]|nr:hypothetical protein BD779DRAFT_1554867 [Infundibulicybe gibba]
MRWRMSLALRFLAMCRAASNGRALGRGPTMRLTMAEDWLNMIEKESSLNVVNIYKSSLDKEFQDCSCLII